MNAPPLERFIYYTGLHLTDTILSREVKKLTYELAVNGKVYLVQKKCYSVFGEYDFIAIKASKPPVHKLVPLSDVKLRELGRTVYHAN